MLKKLLKWKLILPDERDAKQNTPLHYVEERQAFVYKVKNGTYTAVDKKKKVLKLARPLRRCVEKHESEVFQFAEGAELILPDPEDLTLFRKYYRHCLHFAAPPRAETTLQRDETAAVPQRDATPPRAETTLQREETAAAPPLEETLPLDAAR